MNSCSSSALDLPTSATSLSPPSRQCGVTLIESLVAVALVALLASLALPLVAGSSKRRALEGVVAELAIDLRYARTEAVARNAPVSVAFDDDGAISCYVVHTGPGSACHCLATSGSGGLDSPAACEEGSGADAIKTIRLPVNGSIEIRSNVPAMSFSPTSGAASPAGTIAIFGPQGMEVRHVVSPSGRVRSCMQPDAKGSYASLAPFGYKPC